MAQTFSPLACLLLVLAAQHSLADLNSDILEELQNLNGVIGGSSGSSIGAVVAFLVSEHKKMITEVDRFTSALDTDLSAAMEELNKANSKLQNTVTRLDSAVQSSANPEPGSSQSTFVRWGKKSCPDTATVVYRGIAGGKYYAREGLGTNYLCLDINAEYNESITASSYSYIDGLQYRIGDSDLQSAVISCSVCLSSLPTTIMIPSTNTCPQGWTSQYTGYLASAYKLHRATDYICLDGNPETELGGSSSAGTTRSILYYDVTTCSGLPCPPFKNNRAVTCVVCSK